jgi:hypothetical protein
MPYGRKYYVWFTVDPVTGNNAMATFPVGTNGKAYIDNTATVTTTTTGLGSAPLHLFFGTVLTVFQVGRNQSVITDMHMFRGIHVGTIVSQQVKWSILLEDVVPHFKHLAFPVFSISSKNNPVTLKEEALSEEPGYKVHHIQVRRWSAISQYLKYNEIPTSNYVPMSPTPPVIPIIAPEEFRNSALLPAEPVQNALLPALPSAKTGVPKKPQYSQVTTFHLMADAQYDLSKLYAYAEDGSDIFVDYACVVDMRTSKWLNGLFRNIKENASLDAIEESDDEEDFNDVTENKYTDLLKKARIKCKFNYRLKKWIPVDEDKGRGPVVAFFRL